VLVRHILNRWEEDETLMALMRAAATNEAAAERMRTICAEQIGPVVMKVCPDPESAASRAGVTATQVLGLALCRYVLRFPRVVAMSVDDLVHWLGTTLHRYLTE
jgi:hypothetical protein